LKGAIDLSTVPGIRLWFSQDFTIYVPRDHFESALGAAWNKEAWENLAVSTSAKGKSKTLEAYIRRRSTWDWQGSIKVGVNECAGRFHAIRSFNGDYYSLTLRGLKCLESASLRYLGPEKENPRDNFKTYFFRSDKFSDYEPDGLGSQECQAKAAYYAVFQEEHTALPRLATGLVLIAGGTGTGKTTLASGLLNYYTLALIDERLEFSHKWKAKPENEKKPLPRVTPHFVFIGDPVECLPYSDLTDVAKKQYEGKPPLDAVAGYQMENPEKRPIDCTIRILGVDTPNVRSALTDCLRETPSVVFINELRHDDDFRAALEFAGTGHLVVATSHNTSLVDVFTKLIRIHGSNTPAGRAELAKRLRAVIHIGFVSFEHGKGNLSKARLPMIWRATPKAASLLASDGLASLLPRGPRAAIDSPVLGRHWFVDRLQHLVDHDTLAKIDRARFAEAFRDAKEKAGRMDFENF
jgi:hypothetical protein